MFLFERFVHARFEVHSRGRRDGDIFFLKVFFFTSRPRCIQKSTNNCYGFMMTNWRVALLWRHMMEINLKIFIVEMKKEAV